MCYNEFYHSDYNYEKKLKELENIYDMYLINQDIKYAERCVTDLQKQLLRCQGFLSRAYYQKDFVSTLQYSYSVYWKRSKNYSTNRIEYFIGVYKTPKIANGDKYRTSITIEAKRFQGKDKKIAREYAEKLCEKYAYPKENIIKS